MIHAASSRKVVNGEIATTRWMRWRAAKSSATAEPSEWPIVHRRGSRVFPGKTEPFRQHVQRGITRRAHVCDGVIALALSITWIVDEQERVVRIRIPARIVVQSKASEPFPQNAIHSRAGSRPLSRAGI